MIPEGFDDSVLARRQFLIGGTGLMIAGLSPLLAHN
jgi:hypothetical protein